MQTMVMSGQGHTRSMNSSKVRSLQNPFKAPKAAVIENRMGQAMSRKQVEYTESSLEVKTQMWVPSAITCQFPP